MYEYILMSCADKLNISVHNYGVTYSRHSIIINLI